MTPEDFERRMAGGVPVVVSTSAPQNPMVRPISAIDRQRDTYTVAVAQELVAAGNRVP
jgi:hypothetical protein